MVIDSLGNSTMAYVEPAANSGNGAVMASYLPATSTGNDWATNEPTPVAISDTSHTYAVGGGRPLLVADPLGNVTAVWVQAVSGTANKLVWTNTKPAGSATWTGPAAIPNQLDADVAPGDVQLAVGGDGTVAIAWKAYDPGQSMNRIMTAMRPLGGSWSSIRVVSGLAASDVSAPVVAADAVGDFMFLWVADPTAGTAEVQGAGYVAGSGWASGTPAPVSANSNNPAQVHLAATGIGTFAAVWTRGDGTGTGIEAADLGLDPTSWSGTAGFISDTSTDASWPEVAADSYGDTVAVWREYNTGTSTDMVITGRKNYGASSWTRNATPLSDTSVSASLPQIGVDNFGDAVAVWQSNGQLTGTLRTFNGSWATPTTISDSNNSSVSSFTLATDSLGNISAFWSQTPSGGSISEIFESSYDFGSPFTVTTGPTAALWKRARIPVSWKATDWSAIAGYDVRARVAPWNGGFGSWSLWKSGVTTTRARHAAKPGHTYCFSSAATDVWGNPEVFLTQRCTTTPVDDRTATVSAGWTREKVKGFYRGTATVTTWRGATMSLKGIKAKQLALLVAKGPRNGKIWVHFNGTDLGTYRLASPKNHKKVVINLKKFGKVKKGTLSITVLSSGRPVQIDGIYAIK